ncbi:hypothetical protein [Marinobacterium rhizophilum]|uniref:hypothetical protein n=1 Tax=Marinobacterium rhizophilum TaxID=420402 RepID=UPI0003637461|nr:hypothetical protein [Marinobacterium rhizophilum]
MPVKVNLDGGEVWFNLIENENSVFVLTHESGREIQFDTPLELDSRFRSKDFDVYFLAKKNIKESDIYQVYRRESDCRIGWVIPAISLSSDLHDYSANEHFLRYAYIAVRESLTRLNDSFYSNSLSSDADTFMFSDVFHEETALLVLSKETYGEDFSFDIDRVAPSLIKNGYVILTDRNPREIKHEVQQQSASDKIYVEEISEVIESCSLIAELMNSSFSYEGNSAFKFFYLYQIFELLIDEVYKNEQEALIDDLVNARGNSGRTKDSLDKINTFMSEKKRIGLLVNKYVDIRGELNGLRQACNRLLVELGRDESSDFEGYFYRLRNFIFHQYRDFPHHCIELLDDVLAELILIIPSVLYRYRVPENGDS